MLDDANLAGGRTSDYRFHRPRLAHLNVRCFPMVMALDVPVRLLLDGHTIGEGSFRRGVQLAYTVLPGPHRLGTRIEMLGGFSRDRTYGISLPSPGEYVVELEYSRIWGNFTKEVTVRRVA